MELEPKEPEERIEGEAELRGTTLAESPDGSLQLHICEHTNKHVPDSMSDFQLDYF